MSENHIDDKTGKFILKLENLEPGSRARLKRCAGQTLAEATPAMGLFYSLLPPGTGLKQEEAYFLIATLFSLAEGGGKGDFGKCLRTARQEKNSKGLDRRVMNLLDADTSQLPFRLRQAVHYLHSCGVKIDWESLLKDVLYWSHPDRFVQKRWARSYYSD